MALLILLARMVVNIESDKLYQSLQRPDRVGHFQVGSWLPQGRSVQVEHRLIYASLFCRITM
jgi:hypothetical protein